MDYYYSNSNSSGASRGRFSSRGASSYRGNGRGDSSYRGSRGGSSSYSSRGYSSSRGGRGSYYPKYNNSSSKYSSDTSRYASRMEDSYRKADSSGYGTSSHRSDMDLGRKRMRSDSYSQSQSQGGTSSRRSHEMEDYRNSGTRYSNSNSYTDSRSYTESRGVFKKPRITEYKSREEYRSRREIPRSSVSMSKLRSFRGRAVRGRGTVRRGGDSFLARKRAALSKRRAASQLLELRRTKLLRIKRLRERARLRVAEEKAVAEDKMKEDAKAAEDKVKEEKPKDEEKAEKKDTEEGSKEKDKEKEKDKDKEKEKAEDGEINDPETEGKSKKTDDPYRKPFMKLQCPQCMTKCVTFKEYTSHLYQPTHVKAMRERSEQLKQTLAKMRIAQRAKQKKADEEDVTNLNTRSTFCAICKLNYSQEKSTHQISEAHKKMKNFLMPYCKICRIFFKSPMLYERHICTLEHIRRKNALDERLGKSKGSSLEYLNNFMVVDSVGSGDEVEDSKEEKTDEEGKKDVGEKKPEEDMNLGVEFIHKVEVFYCEVCRTYLPRIFEPDRVLRVHCRAKYHLRRYLRFGTDDLLARIQGRKKNEENGEEKDDKEGTKENHGEGGEDEVGMDEKLWADVSDLLSQVEPEAKSDDEDEEERGRFDRFKSNEKKENGEVGAEEENKEEDKKAPTEDEKPPVVIKEEA